MRRPRRSRVGLLLVPLLLWLASVPIAPAQAAPGASATGSLASTSGAVQNFTASMNRIVTLLGISGGGLLAIVWARVALSWFSNDVTKKVQAKDRARDALIGTLLFTAALSGLIWGLAHWVLTGT